MLSINFFIRLRDNDKFFIFSSCFESSLALIASVIQTSSLLVIILKSLTGNLISIRLVMSNILNSKKESENSISTNIRVIKIIAITLGCLIIVGLIALFLGLANGYNNIDNLDKNTKIILIPTEEELNKFNFIQPTDAQLISSSLGKNNQILLRYIYKGNNVLVLFDSNTNYIKSIITLKKESVIW